MSKSKALVHSALDAAFTYGEKIAALQALFKGKAPDAIRTALLPDVASYKKYAVPLIAGSGKAEGTMVLDSEHPKYEACRKTLGRMVKDIVGETHSKTEEIEVPAEVLAAAAKLAKLCAQYEGARKLASTAIAQAFAE
jgi:hypothetical protein